MRSLIVGLSLVLLTGSVLAQNISATSKPGAPFSKVRYSITDDRAACGTMGCEATIEGLDPNGKWVDVTSKKRTMNTYEDKKNGFFGFDRTGMPRLRLVQGTFRGEPHTNTFSYNPRTKSYEY